jgi:signal peptidase I
MKKTTEPWLAVSYSSIFGGLGQIYGGNKNKGLIILCLQVLLLTTGIVFFMSARNSILISASLLALYFLIYIINIFDAFFTSAKNNTPLMNEIRREKKDPWLGVFLSYLFPGIGHFYMKKIIWGFIFFIATAASLFLPDEHIILSFMIHLSLQVGAAAHIMITSSAFNQKHKTNLIILAILILLSNTVTTFYQSSFKAFRIPTASMKNTIQVGDHLITKKITNYKPQRFQLIVFKVPKRNTYYVKRCIAIEGDVIEIKNGIVFINGKKISEPYVIKQTTPFFLDMQKETIPRGKIFVMGDNRGNSSDSRDFGPVPVENVHYRVMGIYWNTGDVSQRKFNRFGLIK